MVLKNINLTNFRNFSDLSLTFSPDINIIYGMNGSGKSNILEAISIVSNLKSFRNINDFEIIKWNEDSYFCSANIENHDYNQFEVGCYYRNSKLQKKVKIDGIELLSSSEYYGKLLTVIISPSDINIITGEPDVRRKYFDSVISKTNIQYLSALIEFKKVLSNRNALLKKIKEYNNNYDIRELDVWDNIYIQKSLLIVKERISFCNTFNQLFGEIFFRISDLVNLPRFIYIPSIKSSDYENLKNQLVKQRNCDIRFGTSTIGPHRDDYILRDDNNRKFNNYASQGQKRLAAITFKIVEMLCIEKITGNKIILLLDDIYPELDVHKRMLLLQYLKRGNQIIFTMANKESIGDITKNFNVANNTVTED